MLSNESFDYVDIALPTYLHAEASVDALNKGVHVLCEKPMALSTDECMAMTDAALHNGKQLMIGQCLRFWPAYEYLQQCVTSGKYGISTAAHFFRGCSTPRWSYRNWMMDGAKSGGALLDLHVHDVDMIYWLFGMPDEVSTLAKSVVTDGGYDIVSTHYHYADGKVVSAQTDWTLQGGFGFEMSFRVNFEGGNLLYINGVLTVNPANGASFTPELSADTGYYREISYFADCLLADKPATAATGSHVTDMIRIAEAEKKSADNGGIAVRPERE